MPYSFSIKVWRTCLSLPGPKPTLGDVAALASMTSLEQNSTDTVCVGIGATQAEVEVEVDDAITLPPTLPRELVDDRENVGR
jgi:hypothetical protein